MKSVHSIEARNDPDEMILTQLSKILKHPLFSTSEILSKFLNFIVNEALAGRQDQIKEYTIAVYVLNKPLSFMPQFDAIVRIHAKRLRNALFTYYDQEDFSNDCVITIPKGRYIPVFERVDNKQLSIKTVTAPLYCLCEPKKNRIAFMPFKTYDHHISRISFVDSLGEELTRQFSYRSELSVLSYHTTHMLSPEKTEIKTLVSSYQVQYLLSGSIWFENSEIKVFVELIDTASETQVWSGIYYQTAVVANYFMTVDKITSAIMSDLSKIKSLVCEQRDQSTIIYDDVKGKTDILYLDSYSKSLNSARRLAAT